MYGGVPVSALVLVSVGVGGCGCSFLQFKYLGILSSLTADQTSN